MLNGDYSAYANAACQSCGVTNQVINPTILQVSFKLDF
jgi:hypothetical protein